MFTRTFSVGKPRSLRRAVSLVLVLGLVTGALLLAGCPMEDDFVDDHQLNQGLVGTWIFPGDSPDPYTITAGTPPTISHPSGFGGYTDYTDAPIEYVYNFSETAGCLIIKREENKYTAVYFKDLTASTVLLGDAYDTSIVYDASKPNEADPATGTLGAAKERFKPENADSYGGGSAQTGNPQQKVPN